MRKPAAVALLVGIALAAHGTDTPPPKVPHGLTVAEEATILAMEDRREFDPAMVKQWTGHSNQLHRLRIAEALGRIGPHAFVDLNRNGKLDGPERPAGVAELVLLAKDADRQVRQMAAFSLGEIADVDSASTLFYLTSEEDPTVAAEAVEAISKVAAKHETFRLSALTRYLWLTDPKVAEGVRARATRYLFRFDDDDASEAAARLLGTPSAAVRQEAAYSLARRAFPPARERLQLLLNDPGVLTRTYAAAALGRIADRASTAPLVAALGDIHPWVRTNAAVALSRIFEKDRGGIGTGDLPRIFAAVDDPDPGVRASMIDVLGYYAVADPEAKKRLGQKLTDGSQWERELAAGAIAKQFAPDGDPFRQLGELTPWQIVRVLEATAAARHGAAIRKKYAAHPAAVVRATVLSSIPDAAVDREIALVEKAFDDEDVVVRATAYDRYGAATRVKAEEWLARLQKAEERERKEKMNDGRIAAIQAAAKLDRPGRRRALTSYLGDADPVVRRVVADEIAKYHGGDVVPYAPLPVKRKASEYEEIVRWSRKPHTATIRMARGTIEMVLLARDAPMTAWNFASLARRKFFDNTTFMRVVPNFVVQGGDPRNDMSGGPGYAIRDEINLQKYTRGAVGMALSGPDTGGSQFFITHSPQPHLDGGYTIFGRVYEGMSGVVDQIERGDRVESIVIDARPPAGQKEPDQVPDVPVPPER